MLDRHQSGVVRSSMVRWLLFNILLLTSVGYALRKGERTERYVATVYIAGIALTQIVMVPYVGRYSNLHSSLMLVDLAIFLALVFISLWTTKFWPLWVAAMQGVSLLSHLSILFGPEVGSTVYGNAVQLWSYPMLVLLLVGTYRTTKRRDVSSTSSSTS